ncbi:hypothetical protein BESB_018370 [Besnoitia besnoiti]|uniref:Conserved oligomeric Golgi complex subunit 3 n=1 Tax=Besnoitia besnoiti TaxID=94643 RepID=A0A2A9M3J8_BESBE|nr:hypothetical protein BESB_018370 [Besnoitia besnoiti]PFH32519.1 hypothetical protein BESB_018370 [Besnoitia besnoiti]
MQLPSPLRGLPASCPPEARKPAAASGAALQGAEQPFSASEQREGERPPRRTAPAPEAAVVAASSGERCGAAPAASEREAHRDPPERRDALERSPEQLLQKFSTMWAHSGGLTGYLPDAQPRAEEARRDSSRGVRGGSLRETQDEASAAGAASDGEFFRYCRAFFREQERQQRNVLRQPLDRLEGLRAPLERVLAGVEQMEEDGARLRTAKEEVRRCTAGMHGACRHLVQEQAQLKHIIEVIQSRLAYYTRYEGLRQLLESPLLVLSPPSSSPSPSSLSSFSGGGTSLDVSSLAKALEFIDEATQFFAIHPDYAEASTYLRNYGTLRMRTRAVIRAAVLQSLEACQASVEKRMQQRRTGGEASASSGAQNNGERERATASSLLDPAVCHVPFRVIGAPLRALTTLLVEQQRKGTDDSYASALDQLEGIFVGMRLRLILPPLKDELKHMLLSHTTLPDAARHIARYCVSVCEMELKTFYVFFPKRREKDALGTLLEAIGNCAYDCLRPPALACDSVEELSEIVESLLLDVLQPLDHVERGKTGDLVPFLSVVYNLVRDVQERLLFRADAFIQDRVSCASSTPTDLVTFIFSSTGFLHVPSSTASSSFSLTSSSSVFLPLQQALHLVTLLRQTVSAEAYGSLCSSALEACCLALGDAARCLELAIERGAATQTALSPAVRDALDAAKDASSASSTSSSSSSSTAAALLAAPATLSLPLHLAMRRVCEGLCAQARDEGGGGERRREDTREETRNDVGDGADRGACSVAAVERGGDAVFARLWAELVCQFFLLKHVLVLQSFLDASDSPEVSLACKKISFPRLLFGRVPSSVAEERSPAGAGCSLGGRGEETARRSEPPARRGFGIFSWFLPADEEKSCDLRSELDREARAHVNDVLAALLVAFTLPLQNVTAQIPAEELLAIEEAARRTASHDEETHRAGGKSLTQERPCLREENLKRAMSDFSQGLRDSLPAVLLLAMLFFDVFGGGVEGEDADEEDLCVAESKEKGDRRASDRQGSAQREAAEESLEFLLQPLFSGILSAYRAFSSLLLEVFSSPAAAHSAVGWDPPRNVEQSLLRASSLAFSAGLRIRELLPQP